MKQRALSLLLLLCVAAMILLFTACNDKASDAVKTNDGNATSTTAKKDIASVPTDTSVRLPVSDHQQNHLLFSMMVFEGVSKTADAEFFDVFMFEGDNTYMITSTNAVTGECMETTGVYEQTEEAFILDGGDGGELILGADRYVFRQDNQETELTLVSIS